MTPKAIEYINKALEKSTDNHYLLFNLAFYYQDLGNTPKAQELLDECIKIDKDNVEFIKLKAEILRQEDNYEQALVEFLRVVEIDESYDIYAQIGDIYEKLDNYNSAITYYEKSLALKPDEIRVMFRLILAYYSVNKNDKALELSFKIDELITELSEKKDSITESQLKDLEETINMINNIKKMLSDLLNTNLN